MFVDSDDWLDEKLSSIIPKLDLQNDVYLFAFSKHSDRKTEIIGLGKQISFEREDFENLQRWILNQYLYPVDYAISAPWGKIYCRRFIVENNCRFPEGIKMGEDKIFNLQVFEFAQKAAYLNITFYNYRVYQKSTVNRYNKYIIADVEAMLNRLADCLKQYNKYNKFKTDYNIRIIMSIMYFITLDFCHVENTQKYIIREKNFINLVTQKTYKNAIKEVNGYSFPIRQKVLFFMIKIKCFFLIEQLNKLNRIYEKIKEDK